MFTGLVEEIGTVKSVKNNGTSKDITVAAGKVMDDLKIDDSVAFNGCCQTVISRTENTFTVTAIEETLRKTTLGSFKVNQQINLERAILPTTRLGGHIVQGHVDCVGKISKITPDGKSKKYTLTFPHEYSKYVINHGSICINGISLTVAITTGNSLTVAIIPHTQEVTIIKDFRVGTEVNLEFDVIAKYLEKFNI